MIGSTPICGAKIKEMEKIKWYEQKLRGWIVPFWVTDIPLVSKRALKYGLSKIAQLVRKQRKNN